MPLPKGARPAICADPNTKSTAYGASMFGTAAARFNVEMMEALLAAGTDPCATNTNGDCPLPASLAPNAPAVRRRAGRARAGGGHARAVRAAAGRGVLRGAPGEGG